MKLQPAASSLKITYLPDGISARMPVRRNWILMAFLLVWLYIWGGSEASELNMILNGNRLPFLLVWFSLWTLTGFWTICMMLWQIAGREIITINATELIHWAGFFGIGRTRRYDLAQIRRLRAVDSAFSHRSTNPPLFGPGTGPIAFDYGARTYHIASSLDEADAYDLVLEMADFMPKQKPAERRARPR